MATGIIGEAGDVLVESRRAALEHLVGFVASSELDFIRMLEIPPHTSLGSVDAQLQAALPTGRHLRHRGIGVDAIGKTVAGIAKAEQYTAEILGFDGIGNHLFRIHLGEGLDLTLGTEAGLVERFEVGEHGLGAGSQDERHGVDPVASDVTDGPQFAAFAGEDAPVVVGFLEQPVLKEMPLNVHDTAEIAALHQGAHLQDGREETAHVIHREHRGSRPSRCGHDPGRFPGGHSQRLFTDHMPARRQRREGLFHMHFVGRRDVDHIDVGLRQQRPVIMVTVDFGDAPACGGGARGGRGSTHRGDLDAEPFERLDVDGADEAGADDARAERVEGGWVRGHGRDVLGTGERCRSGGRSASRKRCGG